MLRARVEAIEAAGQTKSATATHLRAVAAEKLAQGANLTRTQVAARFEVSTKCIQRWESAGVLPRCPGLGAVVRYSARDVLRLASASSRKGA
jgi:DNA-binding transcriptional regulator YiaG